MALMQGSGSAQAGATFTTGLDPSAEEAVVRERFWRKIRRHAGRLPFATEAVAGFYCAIDPATPLRVKAILFAALAYFVLPVDAIPDVMPLIGFTDDLAVVLAATRAAAGSIQERHREAARRVLRTL